MFCGNNIKTIGIMGGKLVTRFHCGHPISEGVCWQDAVTMVTEEVPNGPFPGIATGFQDDGVFYPIFAVEYPYADGTHCGDLRLYWWPSISDGYASEMRHINTWNQSVNIGAAARRLNYDIVVAQTKFCTFYAQVIGEDGVWFHMSYTDKDGVQEVLSLASISFDDKMRAIRLIVHRDLKKEGAASAFNGPVRGLEERD